MFAKGIRSSLYLFVGYEKINECQSLKLLHEKKQSMPLEFSYLQCDSLLWNKYANIDSSLWDIPSADLFNRKALCIL